MSEKKGMVWQVKVCALDQSRGKLIGPGFEADCALGSAGVTPCSDKREGDKKTPLGTYDLRYFFYRPDRLAGPKPGGSELEPELRLELGSGRGAKRRSEDAAQSEAGYFANRPAWLLGDPALSDNLPPVALTPDFGWCDDRDHQDYNCLIKKPFAGRHEALWRDDGLYDLLVVIGHNDRPVVAGLGSAIFMHIARAPNLEDQRLGRRYGPTEGCIALDRLDLVHFLSRATRWDSLAIEM